MALYFGKSHKIQCVTELLRGRNGWNCATGFWWTAFQTNSLSCYILSRKIINSAINAKPFSMFSPDIPSALLWTPHLLAYLHHDQTVIVLRAVIGSGQCLCLPSSSPLHYMVVALVWLPEPQQLLSDSVMPTAAASVTHRAPVVVRSAVHETGLNLQCRARTEAKEVQCSHCCHRRSALKHWAEKPHLQQLIIIVQASHVVGPKHFNV